MQSVQIDTFNESIISLDVGAKHVSKISGTKRNRCVLIRWSNRGVGGVILPTIRIGGELFTSEEKLNWFLNESRAAKTRKHAERTREGIRRVDREAEELGI